MIEILLLEDDPVLGRGLSLNLEHEGYRVTWAKDLHAAGVANQASKFELMLLDVGLPDGSGLDFLQKVRASGSRIPILMLTARTDEDAVVEGLQFGANDYIRKPFGDRELLARIKTALREPQVRSEQVRYGDLLLLVDQRQLLHQGEIVDLSPREFEILSYFLQNAEKVLSRDAILQSIQKGSELFDRTIDSSISHVRSRLRQAGVKSIQISSVYGVGYRLEKA